jgi:hypothetical protein
MYPQAAMTFLTGSSVAGLGSQRAIFILLNFNKIAGGCVNTVHCFLDITWSDPYKNKDIYLLCFMV